MGYRGIIRMQMRWAGKLMLLCHHECSIVSLTWLFVLQNMKNEEMSTIVSMNLVSCELHTVADSSAGEGLKQRVGRKSVRTIHSLCFMTVFHKT